jgi:hypothetical protein
MKAFVEITSGVIRAGEDCDSYGKPFDYAVAFSCVDGKTAVIKALSADGKMSPAHAKAAFRALKDLGLTPAWERLT